MYNYAKQLLQSLESLIKTLVDLCDSNTKIIMSYEERNTGNKLEIKQKFFQVSLHHVTMQLCLPPTYIFTLAQIMADHFTCTEVPFSNLDETFRSEDIHVLVIQTK